jgi:uncharacterized protein (TIGR02246 family)
MGYRSTFVAMCGLAALLLTGCNQAMPDTREADAKAIRDTETQWNQDWAAKDVDKILAHYADNAMLMATGMPSSTGKDAIRKTLQGLLSDPALSLKFQASRVEVARSGEMGYTQGTYMLTMTDPNTKQAVTDHGSYVTTYAKQPDGTWKAVADIATSEVPPQAPVPPAKK